MKKPSNGLKKKENLRSRTKNPALKPNLNLKTRYEEIMDILTYANDLPEKEKKWMNSFVEEYVNANFNHSGKKLHTTKALKKACYDKNNSRNRDILTSAKVTGNAVVFSALTEKDEGQDTIDDIVNYIDKKANYKAWDDES